MGAGFVQISNGSVSLAGGAVVISSADERCCCCALQCFSVDADFTAPSVCCDGIDPLHPFSAFYFDLSGNFTSSFKRCAEPLDGSCQLIASSYDSVLSQQNYGVFGCEGDSVPVQFGITREVTVDFNPDGSLDVIVDIRQFAGSIAGLVIWSGSTHIPAGSASFPLTLTIPMAFGRSCPGGTPSGSADVVIDKISCDSQYKLCTQACCNPMYFMILNDPSGGFPSECDVMTPDPNNAECGETCSWISGTVTVLIQADTASRHGDDGNFLFISSGVSDPIPADAFGCPTPGTYNLNDPPNPLNTVIISCSPISDCSPVCTSCMRTISASVSGGVGPCALSFSGNMSNPGGCTYILSSLTLSASGTSNYSVTLVAGSCGTFSITGGIPQDSDGCPAPGTYLDDTGIYTITIS